MKWTSATGLGNDGCLDVQKVSELILNLNVQVFDVPAGKLIFGKSVDMRGNDDEAWKRAVRYLVRDMAEKRTMNPAYGQ